MDGLRVSGICRADCGGLGTLSRMFSDHFGFHRTLSIARHHGESYHDWYPNNRVVDSHVGISHDDARWLCDGADVVLTFETWYGMTVPQISRRAGVKTALVAMYECTPPNHPYQRLTDLVICPHELCLREMRADKTPGFAESQKVLLPVPVDTQRIAFRHRERAETFVHIAGRSGAYDRNNTRAVIEAFTYHVQSNAKLVIRHQAPLRPVLPVSPNITCDPSRHEDYWRGWEAGDVLLHPHRWDGCSLPMYEALAAGMPVMTTRFWPFCDGAEGDGWLPKRSQRLAIEVDAVRPVRISREIFAVETTPQLIAAAVDRIAGQPISRHSDDAGQFAFDSSWRSRIADWRDLLWNLSEGLPIDERMVA